MLLHFVVVVDTSQPKVLLTSRSAFLNSFVGNYERGQSSHRLSDVLARESTHLVVHVTKGVGVMGLETRCLGGVSQVDQLPFFQIGKSVPDKAFLNPRGLVALVACKPTP